MSKLIRDINGTVVPQQYYDADTGAYKAATTAGGLATNIGIIDAKLIRDVNGTVVPTQVYDTDTGRFVLIQHDDSGGGGSEIPTNVIVNNATGDRTIGIGNTYDITNRLAVALGDGSLVTGDTGTAIGANASAVFGVAVGYGADASNDSVCVGNTAQSKASTSNSVVVGVRATSNASRQVLLGGGLFGSQSAAGQIQLGYMPVVSDNTAFAVGYGTANDARLSLQTITTTGDVTFLGGVQSAGADYAEYFEWVDNNPDSVDRIGLAVSFVGDKVTLANGHIDGIVSANGSMVGNAHEIVHHSYHVRDVYGRVQTETIEDSDGHTHIVPLISDNYDPSKQYVPRSRRSEWATVGLLGRIVSLQDGSLAFGDYCAADEGVLVKSDNTTNVRVMRVIDDKHVLVFIR